MPSPLKCFENGQAYFVSTRTEEGLPFVPTTTMNAMIQSNIAKALQLYSATIVCYLFMSNHFHLIFIVKNPEDAPRIVQYIKQEMSHAVNRMLGRRQKTIWKSEYDSPKLLTGARCISEIAYTLANPCTADLVETPDQYPGVSSYQSLRNDEETVKVVSVFKRSDFYKIQNPHKLYFEDAEYHRELLSKTKRKATIKINPWAIRTVFKEFSDLTVEQLREKIMSHLNDLVAQSEQKRIKDRKSVAGSAKLIRTSMLKTYTPTKYGRKSICLGSTKHEVREYLSYYRIMVQRAKDVVKIWKTTFDFSVPYPAGMFPPSLPRTCNVIPY